MLEKILRGQSAVVGCQSTTSSVSSKIISLQPSSDQHSYRLYGDINEDQEALDFQAGVNASKSLKIVRYILPPLVLQFLQVLCSVS